MSQATLAATAATAASAAPANSAAPAAPAATAALAARLSAIEPFHAMALFRRAAAMQAAGRPIIHMSLGEPDFGAPPDAISALAEAARRGLAGYSPACGIPALREAIAAHYERVHGLKLDPQRVIVTTGGTGALVLACALMLDVGSEVLMPDPTYPCNRHIVSAFSGTTRLIPAGPAKRFQLNAADVDAHWGPATRAVMLASPSNPTGTTIAQAELAAVWHAVQRRGGWFVFDEIYNELTYDGPTPPTALHLSDEILVLNSFSKTFSMTGWRLGWLIVPPRLVPHCEKLMANMTICPPTLAQHAALGCFTPESLAICAQRRDELAARRDFIVPALKRMGIEVPTEPDGAFYVYGDVSRFGLRGDQLADHFLEHAEVSLVPGMDFGIADADRWMRFTYATALPQLQEAAGRMERALGML